MEIQFEDVDGSTTCNNQSVNSKHCFFLCFKCSTIFWGGPLGLGQAISTFLHSGFDQDLLDLGCCFKMLRCLSEKC